MVLNRTNTHLRDAGEMTMPTSRADESTGTTTPTGLRRVVTGALVGTALEWYDFFI